MPKLAGNWAPGHYILSSLPAGHANRDDAVTGTWLGLANNLGHVQSARVLSKTREGINVTTDYYGDTVVDQIYRGKNTVFQCQFQEWFPELRAALDPIGNTMDGSGMPSGAYDDLDRGNIVRAEVPVGRMMSDFMARLVLTPVLYTPASTIGIGPSVFDGYGIPEASAPMGSPLGNVERITVVTFRVLPWVRTTGVVDSYRERYDAVA